MSFFSDERAAEMRELFFESAAELLQILNEEGLKLEKHPQDGEILREVRRTVHTLKGDSAACGYQEMSSLAHELEDALTPEVAAQAKHALAEIVLIAADTFSSMLSAYRGQMQPPDGEELRLQIVSLMLPPEARAPQRLRARFLWSEYEQMAIADAVAQGKEVLNIALRIDPHCPMRSAALQLIRNVLQECGQLLAIAPDQGTLADDLDVVEAAVAARISLEAATRKCRIPSVVSEIVVEPGASQETPAADVPALVEQVTSPAQVEDEPILAEEEIAGELQETSPAAQTTSNPETPATSFSAMENLLRVDAERIDAVLNLIGELVIAKSMMHQAIGDFDKRFPRDPLKIRFADATAFQARILNDLQKAVMKIRMVPVEQLFRRFPRVVRDVAKSCGKEVELAVNGQDTDLDKSILDALAEPLAHLVRNSVDHGIESPAERINAGKPAHGTVTLAAYHQGNQIVIEVSDDGRGIDRDKLVAKAIERGVLGQTEAAALSEQDVLNLVFHPGLSTADQVTSISGRGVGMDVARSVVERLKGAIGIRTTAGLGTTFSLKVPLTLAIIKALLFRVGERMYAVPLAAVAEITRASKTEIHTVDGQNVISLRDDFLPLVHLHGMAGQPPVLKKIFVVVVSLGERRFGLVVDSLVGEEELVIKTLDDHLVATDLVSGASIRGDGTVVLILNISSVVTRLGRTPVLMGALA
ncbi:MAG TPA: chemotaxis protein CheA [Candidatus Angelobacter sp.]